MSPTPHHQPPRVLAYCRVSTDDQVNSGAGLTAQRTALEAEAVRRGWIATVVVEEGRSARDLNRPVLLDALARLDAGEFDVLAVAKLDRLSRSVHDFTGLVKRADRRGWSVVCLDLGVDTTTAAGGFMANVMSATAEFERKIIGQRTREALAVKRAEGVRLGRPQTLPMDTVARIVREHRAGASLRTIGTGLEADGVPTARGGPRWHANSIRQVLGSQAAALVPAE